MVIRTRRGGEYIVVLPAEESTAVATAAPSRGTGEGNGFVPTTEVVPTATVKPDRGTEEGNVLLSMAEVPTTAVEPARGTEEGNIVLPPAEVPTVRVSATQSRESEAGNDVIPPADVVFDTPQRILNFDTTIKKMDTCLKSERQSLSTLQYDGELLKCVGSRGTNHFQQEVNKKLVTRLLNFDENCRYTVEDRLFWGAGVKSFFQGPWIDNSSVNDMSQEELPANLLNNNAGDRDKQLEGHEGVATNESEGNDGGNNQKHKAQRSFLCPGQKWKNMMMLQSNQSNKHKKRKVSPNMGHVENLDYLIQYVSKKVSPDHEEGNSVAMDSMWAMGIILSYLLYGYPALKGTEDIKCHNKIGIRPEAAELQKQKRLERDGHTFPAKEWCNLTQPAREHTKHCIHFHPGNCPCLRSILWKQWIVKTEEAIVEKERLENLYYSTNTGFNSKHEPRYPLLGNQQQLRHKPHLGSGYNSFVPSMWLPPLNGKADIHFYDTIGTGPKVNSQELNKLDRDVTVKKCMKKLINKIPTEDYGTNTEQVDEVMIQEAERKCHKEEWDAFMNQSKKQSKNKKGKLKQLKNKEKKKEEDKKVEHSALAASLS
eukprot:jgi/Psemu1/6334/gm1.6334_g